VDEMNHRPAPTATPIGVAPAAPTVLPPAARLLWRSAHEAQLELGTHRVVLTGVDTDAVRRLIGAGGAGDDGDGLPGLAAARDDLLDAGLLWPAPPTDGAAARDPRAPRPADPRRAVAHPRLAGELTALTARVGEGAAEVLAARRHSTVLIQGAGRVGPQLGAVLAAAGVGRVHTVESGRARLHQALPGGLTPADEGLSLSAAAALAAERQAPEASYTTVPFGDPPDLIVLAVDEPVDLERRDALHARAAAHLLVRVSGGHGAVGPLVLPGLTSCLRCTDLHRLDRDPAWDALALQLSITPRHRAASEVALATVIGGLAAVQALEFLDGGRPASIEASLEMQLPDWRLRRRSWPIHPECDCLPRQ
jgi:hypothetical protein